MSIARRQQFVFGQAIWMLGTIVLLSVLSSQYLGLFIALSLFGLIFTTELTATFNLTPQWRTRLRGILLVGLLIFGYAVTRRVLEIVPDGLL